MIYITNWAKNHVAAARRLIGLLHIFLVISAVQLSRVLINAGIRFSFTLALFSAIATFCAIVIIGFYRKKLHDRVARMRLQKFRFLLAGICSTLFVISFFSNQFSSDYSITNGVKAAFTKAEKKEKPSYKAYNDKKVFYKELKAYYSTLSKKELRKELRHELKNMAKTSSGVETVIFAFIISMAIIAALLGVMVLACSLSCNGQGALAVLVLAGGITGIIFLVIYLGKLFRKDREKRKAAELKTTGT